MGELLIPFGIHKDTGEIVEPEDAPKGRDCNCICPGCKAPLLSRHPKEKRFHFAHDSRHEHAKPEEDCPFSSAVAVAMMVRELAADLGGKMLFTPPLDMSEHFHCCGQRAVVEISGGASNAIDDAQANVAAFDHHVDLKLVISGYPILVDLVYKGKPAIDANESELQSNKAGLLELNCDSFSISNFKNDRNVRFSEAVLDFVLNTGYRRWRFHPKTASALQKSRQEHRCIRQASQINKGHWHHSGIVSKAPTSTKIVPKRYLCVVCNREWVQDSSSAPDCPGCHSHLYASPVE